MIAMAKSWNTSRKSLGRNSHIKGTYQSVSLYISLTLIGKTVEVEKCSLIENKDKLKVVVVPQIISPRQSAESSIYGDSGSVEMPGLSSTPSGSSKHRPRVITDDDSDMSFDTQRLPRRSRLPVISDDESASYCSTAIDPEDNIPDFETVKPKKRKVVKDLDDAVPLPSPYPLPSHYSSSVEAALKEGRLSHVTRQAFLSSVASSMLSYKRYPTYEDYFNVAHTIIQKYPFMKSPIGSPTVSFVSLICFLYNPRILSFSLENLVASVIVLIKIFLNTM